MNWKKLFNAHRVFGAKKPYCCWVRWQRPSWVPFKLKKLFGCRADAEYQLVDGYSPDDVTEACHRHVGHLLRDGRETAVVPIEWTISTKVDDEKAEVSFLKPQSQAS